MSFSVYSIGISALHSAQLGIEVAGRNITHASDPSYHRRQVIRAESSTMQGIVGNGVKVRELRRLDNESLVQRVNTEAATAEGLGTRARLLGELEAVVAPMTSTGTPDHLNAFFDAARALSSGPEDQALRLDLVERGEELASHLRATVVHLDDLAAGGLHEARGAVDEVNELTAMVAATNKVLLNADDSVAAGDVVDQREAAIRRLSELIDVRIDRVGDGVVNLSAGGAQLVLNTTAVELELDETADRSFTLSASGVEAVPEGGVLAGLQTFLSQDLTGAREATDAVASALIHEVNRVHATSAPLGGGFRSLTAKTGIEDPFAPLAAAELVGSVSAGELSVNVVDDATGAVTEAVVAFDPAVDTLADVASRLDAVADIGAAVNADGQLEITAAAGKRFHLADRSGGPSDPTGLLGALGMHAFFTGTGARDIAVNAELRDDPQLVSVSLTGAPGDGGGAVRIGELAHAPLASLGGVSIEGYQEALTGAVGATAYRAGAQEEASTALRDAMEAQLGELTGVSIDEEVMSLVQHEQAYQAAAHFLEVVGRVTQILVDLGRA